MGDLSRRDADVNFLAVDEEDWHAGSVDQRDMCWAVDG